MKAPFASISPYNDNGTIVEFADDDSKVTFIIPPVRPVPSNAPYTAQEQRAAIQKAQQLAEAFLAHARNS